MNIKPGPLSEVTLSSFRRPSKNSSPLFPPRAPSLVPPTMRGARTLAGGRPTVAVAGGAKLANKQAARPAAPQMLGSSAAKKNSSDAAAAAANVKVAAIKPPASAAQTYANDEAPLKLSIGEAPGMGESSDSVVEMRGRASCELRVGICSKEPRAPLRDEFGLENSKKAFHVSSNVISFSCID